jgi:hypothetical protein
VPGQYYGLVNAMPEGGVAYSQEGGWQEEHGVLGDGPHLVRVLPRVGRNLEVGLGVLVPDLVPRLSNTVR